MPNIALLGASNRQDSLALKIQHRIIDRGFSLFPINPKYPKIDGIKAYPNLITLTEEIDLAVFMVNPELSLQILDQVAQKKIKKVWFQPGSFDDTVIQKAEKLGLESYYQHCILVANKEAFLKVAELVE